MNKKQYILPSCKVIIINEAIMQNGSNEKPFDGEQETPEGKVPNVIFD